MEYYRIPLYILFGVLPSLVWLFYYMQKDLHPEPKRTIVKVFFLGALVTMPVFLLQIGFSFLLNNSLHINPVLADLLKWFLVIALTEEGAKFLVVKMGALKSSALDEPLDIMLYMVVAALGFAAVENVFYLFSPIDNVSFSAIIQTTVFLSFIRFIGGTFLHTLCSALAGLFIAESLMKIKKHSLLPLLGLSLATTLHGFYDFSIITIQSPFNFLIPLLIVVTLAVIVMYYFSKMRKMKGISKL